MSRKPTTLPDLDDDDEFRRKLSPLVETTIPEDRKPVRPEHRRLGVTETLTTVMPDIRISDVPDNHKTGDLVAAAEKQARIEAVRGTKRRFEYLIPERVGRALAEDAAAQGKSATTRLLEVLRDAGYPVIREDMVDLRKMPKR
jgi:hypothetical protein